MRAFLQHHFNALHVRGVLYSWADAIAAIWEKLFHPLLYRSTWRQ